MQNESIADWLRYVEQIRNFEAEREIPLSSCSVLALNKWTKKVLIAVASSSTRRLAPEFWDWPDEPASLLSGNIGMASGTEQHRLVSLALSEDE